MRADIPTHPEPGAAPLARGASGALFTSDPYLAALERSGSAAPRTGWTSRRAEFGAPVYAKAHFWGEFVFDFAWAEAHERLGLRYYPKLACCAPFTPVPGPRVASTQIAARLERAVADENLSGAHVLFAPESEAALLESRGWLRRDGLRYTWRNAGYATLEDFLGRLAGKKRKNILAERRALQARGLRISWRPAEALTAQERERIHALYANTYHERGQHPYLAPECLALWSQAFPMDLLFCLCHDGDELLAMAFYFRDGGALYGRHWGAARHVPGLHFELCYYQGIEYCIAQRLAFFDAGVQGEHKLARGFEPERTFSLHWIVEPRLREAIARWLRQERAQVAQAIAHARQHGAFRPPPSGGSK